MFTIKKYTMSNINNVYIETRPNPADSILNTAGGSLEVPTKASGFLSSFVSLFNKAMELTGLSFTSGGNATISGTLNVNGDVTFDSDVNCDADLFANASLDVADSLTVGGPAESSVFSLAGTSTNTGAAVGNNTFFVGTEDGLLYWKDNSGTTRVVTVV